MRMSHKNKWLYIAPPKTGSETLRGVLDRYTNIKGGGPEEDKKKFPPYTHATAHELQICFKAQGWDWNEYFKFSVARNPWSRVVSIYKYGIQQNRLEDIPFKEAVKTWNKYMNHWSCYDHHFDKQGNQIVDFILKLENLQEDFDVVCDRIGIPPQQLPHVNKTKHKHYTEYYDDETREIVAKKYKKDIEQYGYTFEK